MVYSEVRRPPLSAVADPAPSLRSRLHSSFRVFAQPPRSTAGGNSDQPNCINKIAWQGFPLSSLISGGPDYLFI